MSKKVVIVYNAPREGRYHSLGEGKAVTGILDAVAGVGKSLGELGYNVRKLPLSPPVEDAQTRVKKIRAELIFNLFEGFEENPETEATIAFALLQTKIPITGCPASALALSQNKARALSLLGASGVAVPKFQKLNPSSLGLFSIDFPCLVKLSGEHGSHGLSERSVVYDYQSLVEQVSQVWERWGCDALVEEFIDGRELRAAILGNRELMVLPISEIVYSLPEGLPRIVTYEAKWEEDSIYFRGTLPVSPADVSTDELKRINEIALAVYRLIGCRGYARIELRQDKDGVFRVIDINPNPDISPTAGVALQAKAAGMSYTELISKIVQFAEEKESAQPTSNIGIRAMTSQDKAAVMNILLMTWEFSEVDLRVAEEVIDAYLARPRGSGYNILLAEADSVVVGFVVFGRASEAVNTWYIFWIAVAPPQKGSGIGTRLLTYAENAVKKEGGYLLLIETSGKPEYHDTRRFYQSRGYREVTRIKDFYAPGNDRITCEKRFIS